MSFRHYKRDLVETPEMKKIISNENKQCPLNRNYYCDDRCKWFNEDEGDCALLINIDDLTNVIKKGLDALWRKT